MRRSIVAGFLSLGLSVGVMALAKGEHNHDAAKSPATAPSTQPVNKMCPIMNEPVNPKVTVTYNGKVYAFCCKECIAEFNKNPEKYKDAK